MDYESLLYISPFIRKVYILQTNNITGNWIDYDHCFTAIMQGEANFYVEGKIYHLVKGDVIIMTPGLKHVILSTSEEILLQYIFHFDFFYDPSRVLPSNPTGKEFHKQYTIPEGENLLKQVPLVTHINNQDFSDLQSSFLNIHNEYISKHEYSDLNMKSICIKILTLCLRNNRKVNSNAQESNSKVKLNLQRGIEYIRRNYDNPLLSNELISHAISISPNYLSHIFKKELGITVHKYVTLVRIEVAQKIIVMGTMNITEVALNVGFASIHTFSKVFKKSTGLSPSEFLQNNLDKPEDITIKTKY
jgi:AraC-like DNA-binding protein